MPVTLDLEARRAGTLLLCLFREGHRDEEHGLLSGHAAALRNDLRELPVDQLREALNLLVVVRSDHAVRLASDTQFDSASRRHGETVTRHKRARER